MSISLKQNKAERRSSGTPVLVFFIFGTNVQGFQISLRSCDKFPTRHSVILRNRKILKHRRAKRLHFCCIIASEYRYINHFNYNIAWNNIHLWICFRIHGYSDARTKLTTAGIMIGLELEWRHVAFRIPADTSHWPNAGSMFAQSRRLCANIDS